MAMHAFLTPVICRLSRWLVLFSAFFATINTLRAQSGDYEGFSWYRGNHGFITITGYSGPGGMVAIPSIIDGFPVEAIVDNAFKGNATILGINIPNSIRFLGDGSFDGCTGLTSVIIPGSLFSGGGFVGIGTGDSAFANCTGLTSVTFNAGTEIVRHGMFRGCENLSSVTIPDSITVIGNSAFEGCTSLDFVGIPSTVTSIGAHAFSGCTSLQSLPISNGVTGIGQGAFSGCTSLTSVTIPGNVTGMEGGIFSGCTGLTSVSISGSVGFIREATFAGCTSLTSVTIGNGIHTIGSSSFAGCSGLTSVVLPASLSTMVGGAFADCSNLTSVTFEGNAPSLIFYLHFYNASPSLKLYYYAGATGFDSWAYSGMSVNLGDRPENFTWTSDGSAITITGYTGPGGNVTPPLHIGGIPIRKIEEGAFSQKSSLTTVTILDSVTSIGRLAFSSCTGLVSVHIGSGVTTIGDQAFIGCTALLDIEVAPGNAAIHDIDGVLFDAGHTTLIQYPGGRDGSYVIPASVTSIAKHAFAFCENLDRVVIPGAVTAIGESSFSGCTGLADATFAGNAPTLGNSAFSDTAPGFTVYFHAGASGFSTPLWQGYPAVMLGISTSLLHRWSFGDATDSVGGADLTLVGNATLSAGQLRLPGSATPRTHYATIPIGGTIAGLESMTVEGWFMIDTLTQWSKVWVFGTTGGDIGFIPRSTTHPRMGIAIPGGLERNTGGGPNPPDLEETTPYHVVAVFDAPNNQMRLYIDGVLADSTDMGGANVGQAGHTVDNFLGAASYYGDPDLHGRIDELRIWNRPLDEAEIAAHYAAGADDELTWTHGDLIYKRAGAGIAIAGYTGPGGAVVIPSQIDGLPVTQIGSNAFNSEYAITSVTLPDSVTHIGVRAFSECIGMTSLALGEGLEEIGFSAFYNCWRLTALALPNSVTSIAASAFEDCASLTAVTIPGSVTSIGASAFRTCNGLTTVTIGGGVTDIGIGAFSNCLYLTDITIPASVTNIGFMAFRSCSALTRATFAGNAPTLGSDVFQNTAPGFTVYYHFGSTGFTSPLWNGYPAVMLVSFTAWPALESLPVDKRGPDDRNGPLELPNLLAFAMGLNPLEAAPEDLPSVSAAPSEGIATLRYRRAKNATGVSLAPMTSTSLSEWASAGVITTTVVQDGGDWEVVEIEVPAPSEGLLFFRLDAVEE